MRIKPSDKRQHFNRSNTMAQIHVVFAIFAVALQFAGSRAVPVTDDVRATEPIFITDSKTNEVFAKQFFYNPAENGLLNWYDSMQWCQGRGYEPGRVESASENQIVANTLNQQFATSRVFWLGASDWGQEAQFYWIQTGQRFQYHNFVAGYPNGGPAESCAYVWGDGNWYDQYCTVNEVRPLCQQVTRVADGTISRQFEIFIASK